MIESSPAQHIADRMQHKTNNQKLETKNPFMLL